MRWKQRSVQASTGTRPWRSRPSPLSSAGWFTWSRGPVADNAHGDPGDPTDDFCLSRIIEDPDFAVRMRMRDHHQPATVDLAPATHIAIPQFRKVDRPIEIGFPWRGTDLSLGRVNLHQRTGPN